MQKALGGKVDKVRGASGECQWRGGNSSLRDLLKGIPASSPAGVPLTTGEAWMHGCCWNSGALSVSRALGPWLITRLLHSPPPLLGESESEVSQSCPTLCDPVDCSLPGSSVHGILQARILEWVAISFSGYMEAFFAYSPWEHNGVPGGRTRAEVGPGSPPLQGVQPPAAVSPPLIIPAGCSYVTAPGISMFQRRPTADPHGGGSHGQPLWVASLWLPAPMGLHLQFARRSCTLWPYFFAVL